MKKRVIEYFFNDKNSKDPWCIHVICSITHNPIDFGSFGMVYKAIEVFHIFDDDIFMNVTGKKLGILDDSFYVYENNIIKNINTKDYPEYFI